MYKEKDQLLAGFPESFAADGYTSERLRVPVLWWTLQATQRAPSPGSVLQIHLTIWVVRLSAASADSSAVVWQQSLSLDG